MPTPKGCHLSLEHRIAISSANKGHVMSLETRAKISKQINGIKRSEETKTKLRNANLGRKLTDLQKVNVLAALERTATTRYEKRRITSRCPQCGKEFKRARWLARYKNSYCSSECYNAHRIQPVQLSDQLIQFVLGGLLGDSSLKHSHNGHYQLLICHTTKDIGYLEHKYAILKRHQLTTTEIRIEDQETLFPGGRLIKTQRGSFQTRVCAYFTFIHDHFYNSQGRTITKWALDQINEEGLAYWYQDDGNLAKDRLRITLSTQCFPESSIILLKQWLFDKFQIKSTSHKPRADKQQWVIVISSIDALRFLNLVRPYIVPCMHRKLPIKLPAYFIKDRDKLLAESTL